MRKCLLIFSTVVAILACASCGNATTLPFDYYQNYVVEQGAKGKADAKWTDYLFYHLSKRAKKHGLVVKNFADGDACLRLNVHIDPSLDGDYQIDRQRLYVQLTARTPDLMLWLIYQFIAGVAEQDYRIDASDLPPAIIEPVSQTGRMAFEWRGIYSPSNADGEMLSIRGTHHADYNWGLWGHNLAKAVGMKPEYAATVGGTVTEEQYCFSSDELYEAIVAYIKDNFGEGNDGNGTRISIMPLDNELACQCDRCRKAGNTEGNATPAVAAMVERLARRFPNHCFFMAAYGSTRHSPAKALPANTGVFVSAIDVPMRADFKESEGFGDFDAMLREWKTRVGKLYVWDYTRNFDDYLTPYPCLKLFASRARYYNNVGVSGLFLNGSGDDYSSFDDVQTFVLTALMMDPAADIDALVRKFFAWYYPETADMLAEYYLQMENAAANGHKTLPFYGGIGSMERAFLDRQAFEAFWQKLDRASKKTTDEERKLLGGLLTALDFTRLELIRSADRLDKTAAAEALAVMEGYKDTPSMRNYREVNGSLADYIRQWRTSPLKVETADALLYEKLECPSADIDGSLGWLTDGRLGFASDYHTAWISTVGNTVEVRIPAASVAKASNGGKATLTIGFLLAPKWHLFTPAMATIRQGSSQLKSAGTPDDMQEKSTSVYRRDEMSYQLSGIDAKKDITIELTGPGFAKAHFAIDEITMNP